ncbi:hypothetical protein [Plantactinospora sp. CA-290183]|uniref:hypothetical protein n=1 Tax=Plantactinospora sp. CA-290183 TaxID=3240006 RepID=UPI003D92ADCB
MSDAHLSDRPSSADSRPIEVSSEPITLGGPGGPGESPVDITPEPDSSGTPGGRPSRRRVIVLGSVLAVALAGGAVFGTVGWRIAQEKDASLGTPPEVAGLTRDDSERAVSTADYLRTGFAADINAEQSIGVVYADPAAAERSVLLFGGTALVWQPERDLDRLFALVADGEGTVTGLREVEAGALGGVMKCGTVSGGQGADMAVCGWADHGSVVMAMFPGRPVDESAALLRDIRGTIQTRD